MRNQTAHINVSKVNHSFWSDFSLLVKFRLTAMVVFSSVAAFLIASSFAVGLKSVLALAIGGFLVAGASNALNEVLEKDFDKMMERTADRPIAAGRMTISTGVLIAGMMSLLGITILSLFNPLTGLLGMISLILYAFVYTPMKRYSPVAVLLGAVPGAMPMLIGCVAYEGGITSLALMLFLIQFLWQIPHFWAIGFLSFDDYNNAGYKFIPQAKGEIDSTVKTQSLFISLSLVLVPIGFIYLGGLSISAVILMAIAGVAFTYTAYKFFQSTNRKTALQLMFGSIIYLPTVLIIMLIDNLI